MAGPEKPRGTGLRLFWRIYLYGLILIVLLLAVLGVIGAAFNRLPAPLELADPIADALSGRVQALLSDPPALQRELERAAKLSNMPLVVYGLDGVPLAVSSGRKARPLLLDELRRLERGPIRIGEPRLRLLIVVPLPRAHPVAYLGVAPSLAAVVVERLAVVLATTLLVIALVSIPVARALSAPLERLTATARALGQGDLSVRSGIRRRDEVGLLAAAFDEMAERLERLIRGEKELLANVSHELRTPLARIKVALELAEEGDVERLRRYLEEVREDVGELEGLVSDILTTARLELLGFSRGIPPLRRERVEPGALLERCAERFRTAHPARTLEARIEGPLPAVAWDAALVRRAVDNLVDNARKYSDEGTVIRLEARAEEEGVAVEVKDQGIGIEAEDLPRLFTPFFRTDRSRARGTGGVGLGLALARRIVEAHGGRISVQSAPGQGTTIRLTLPGEAKPGTTGTA